MKLRNLNQQRKNLETYRRYSKSINHIFNNFTVNFCFHTLKQYCGWGRTRTCTTETGLAGITPPLREYCNLSLCCSHHLSNPSKTPPLVHSLGITPWSVAMQSLRSCVHTSYVTNLRLTRRKSQPCRLRGSRGGNPTIAPFSD